MSMVGYFIRITSEQCKGLQAGTLATKDVLPEVGHYVGWMFGENEDSTHHVAVGKMWQAIHFLLSGDANECKGPLGDLVLGGQEVGEDLAYGPARVHVPQKVIQLDVTLRAASTASLRERFEPKVLTQENVYPNIWDRDPEGLAATVLALIAEIRVLFRATSERGDAILTFVS